MQKGFAPISIIVLILVIALAAGAYLIYSGKILIVPARQTVPYEVYKSSNPTPANTNPDETVNWKTYTTNSYSLKYPSKWIIDTGSNTLRSPEINEESITGLLTKGARLTIQTPPYTRSYGKQVDEQVKRAFSDCASSRLTRTLYIDSYQSQEYTYFCPGSNPGALLIFIPTESGIFTIDFDYQPKENLEIKNIFDQILSTFKFN